jgi:hypothetical protein
MNELYEGAVGFVPVLVLGWTLFDVVDDELLYGGFARLKLEAEGLHG